MKTFTELNVCENIVNALAAQKIIIPTEVQQAVIPTALENRDVIAESRTGSGKTFAYLVPLFHKVDAGRKENQAIILCPSHELASQVAGEVKKLAISGNVSISCQLCIGETNLKRLAENLKTRPQIIVGTPGRIMELIDMKAVKAHTVKTIVMDEADKLVDGGSIKLCMAIIKATQKDRQLMAFSASIDDIALKQLHSLMRDPVEISIDDTSVNPNIQHFFIRSEERDKSDVLRKLSSALFPEKILVFMNRNDDIDNMEKRLVHHQVNACSICSENEREVRRQAIQGFRSGRYQVMLASDVAARGLDIENLNIVVNVDLPKDAQEYLHRVGRTARYQNSGIAVSIVGGIELSFMKDIARSLKISFTEKRLRQGQLLDVTERKDKDCLEKK